MTSMDLKAKEKFFGTKSSIEYLIYFVLLIPVNKLKIGLVIFVLSKQCCNDDISFCENLETYHLIINRFF